MASRRRLDGGLDPGREILGQGRLPALALELDPGQAPGPIDPGQGDEFVQVFPGQPGQARAVDGLDDPPLVHHLPEAGELRLPHQVGDVFELQPEAGVRPVQPEAVHAFLVGQAGEGRRQLHVLQFFKQGRDHALHHLVDVLFGDEGHLHVDLGELGLAVGPQILIPEAPAQLIVAVQAGHHQELLEELGRLGQGEELPRLDPAGHQVIPGPLRRALGEDGGLHLDEALAVEKLADHLGGPVPEEEVLHDAGAPEVQVAVFQPQGLGDVHLVVFQLEGRGLGGVQNAQLFHHDLDLPGGQIRVEHLRRPEVHQAPHRDDVLIPEHPGLDVGVGIGFRVEDHLGQPLPVPEVHKDEAAVVAPALDPAHEHHLGAVGRSPQITAGMAAGQTFKRIKHVVFPSPTAFYVGADLWVRPETPPLVKGGRGDLSAW